MAEAAAPPAPETEIPNEPPEEAPRIGRVPPHSLEAEESLLGACMLSRQAVEHALHVLQPEDFYVPANARIFAAISDLTAAGAPIDVTTLHGWLRDHDGEPPIERKRILEIQGQTPASAHYAAYAQTIAELASRRRLARAGQQIGRLAFDMELAPAGAVTRAHELVADADIAFGGTQSQDLGSFLAEQHDPSWVWPQHLEESERLLIVAPEKFGKSTMIRQIGIMLSQGQDPFTLAHIPPALVYILDLENPPNLVRRKLAAIFEAINTLQRPAATDTLRIDCRPEGLDITQRAELSWLHDRIAANRHGWKTLGYPERMPLIVCIGPVYKLHEDENDRIQVAKVCQELDRIRIRYRCALIMETHAPHEAFREDAKPHRLRPAGPRRWLRWPEFCRGIEPASGVAIPEHGPNPYADFYDCQGARDERAWPTRLKRGGKLPWLVEGAGEDLEF